MSTRYMKKVYGSDVIPEKENDSASDTEISVTNDIKAKSFNVFNVLNRNSDNDEHDDSDKQEDGVTNDANCNETKHKKKKRKRKKPENVKNQQQYDVECDKEIDEIEQSIWEVHQLYSEPIPGCSNQAVEPKQVDKKSKEDVLTVQHKHLNPYNEMKKIFGSKTVQTDRKHNSQRNRGRSGYLKKTWLISPRENWPPIYKSGLSMSLDHSVEIKNNEQYFVYGHSHPYRQIQLKFLEAVESSNPENIMSILYTHSYHIDALLQMAELFKLSEDLPMAAEFIERALYCLEYAFHPSFNITTGQCRLDYRKQQNRALFITLFKHLGFVGGRACYRTSLEFCKLLLSLDPDGDPLAVVLLIDFYALKAKEYEWFIEFCELWDLSRNLTQLPNIAYSLALVHFRSGNKDADTLLEKALMMFPGVLMLLLEKCSIQTDAKVMRHNFFNLDAQASTPPALEKLQNLYVARSFHFWKETDILLWLEKCVHAVLNQVESKDESVEYCKVKRSQRYRGNLPRNILRHIILADIKEVTIDAQEIQTESPVLSFDPLPPKDSIDIYYKRSIAYARLAHQRRSNFFSLFFTSLFADINGDVTAALNGLNLFEENDEHDA